MSCRMFRSSRKLTCGFSASESKSTSSSESRAASHASCTETFTFFTSGGRLPLLWFLRPVVAVVANRTDQLVVRNYLQRKTQVTAEPFLRRDRARLTVRRIFVVVHHHDAIRRRRYHAVVEVFVMGRNADVQLHSPGMQFGRQLMQQRSIAGLRVLRKILEIDHQPAILVRRQKLPDFAAESVPAPRLNSESSQYRSSSFRRSC